MKFFTKKKRLTALIFLALFPFITIAAEIRLDTGKADLRTAEQFVVDVVVYTDESVNAIEGRLVFSPEMLEVKEIRDGNTSVNFWIEKPKVLPSGEIIFSGITPGGFKGVNNHLFSVIFEAKKEGQTSIEFQEATALQNDGEGTKIPLSLRNIAVNIKKGDSSTRDIFLEDTVLPESFNPTVTHSPALSEDAWFVAFSTQDKDSGISHYDIKEYRFASLSFFSPWKIAESPYVLKDQELKSHIVIRAFDNEGNARIIEIKPAYPLIWHEYIVYWFILIVAAGFLIRIFLTLWRRLH